MIDYYKILNVSEVATPEEIKKSYRQLAMKWHPDRNADNKGAEEKFKEIQIAYDTLSNPQKRKEYDMSRQFGFGSNNSSRENSGFSGEDFEDVLHQHFSDIFNQNFSDIFNRKNFIQSIEVNVSFWEAIKGGTKTFQLAIRSKKGTKFLNVSIPIPEGTNTGDQFLIEVEGQKLQVVILVEPDPKFQRDNLDLYLKVDIPFSIAMLGGEVIFPHWQGDLDIKIPECLQNNQKIRISNKGVKKGMFVGDLYLIANIVLPKKLTEEQMKIIKEFQKTEENQSWLSSVKNIWKKIF